jgi:hypothetical protein
MILWIIMNEVEILLFLSLKFWTLPQPRVKFHIDKMNFFSQKNNSFLIFQIIIFSMIYYEVLI